MAWCASRYLSFCRIPILRLFSSLSQYEEINLSDWDTAVDVGKKCGLIKNFFKILSGFTHTHTQLSRLWPGFWCILVMSEAGKHLVIPVSKTWIRPYPGPYRSTPIDTGILWHGFNSSGFLNHLTVAERLRNQDVPASKRSETRAL